MHGKGGEFGLNENGGDEIPGVVGVTGKIGLPGVPGSIGVDGGLP